MNAQDASVRRTAIVMIGVVLCVVLVCFTIIALETDRELSTDANILVIGVFFLAVLGGSIIVWRRAEIEPATKDENGGNGGNGDGH